ncbi:MAG: hypothetical protein QME51_08565, partial [Planctomycetota bacterium]|nr:hypothetical protein [Planctomycetota bacterium]
HNDDQYIDELVHQVFVVVWQCLKDRKFEQRGEGSFRKWLYGVSRLECYTQDINRSKEPMTTSTLFPLSFADIPVRSKPEDKQEDDAERVQERLKAALSKLTPEEQGLMQMVAEGIKYKDILKDSMFAKYKSVDSLKDKIYRIRKRFNPDRNRDKSQ